MKTMNNTVVNNIAIREAIEEAAEIVRATEARSARLARLRNPLDFVGDAATLAAWIEAATEAEELALRPEGEVLVSFLDDDEDFLDADTEESLTSGFSVRF